MGKAITRSSPSHPSNSTVGSLTTGGQTVRSVAVSADRPPTASGSRRYDGTFVSGSGVHGRNWPPGSGRRSWRTVVDLRWSGSGSRSRTGSTSAGESPWVVWRLLAWETRMEPRHARRRRGPTTRRYSLESVLTSEEGRRGPDGPHAAGRAGYRTRDGAAGRGRICSSCKSTRNILPEQTTNSSIWEQ